MWLAAALVLLVSILAGCSGSGKKTAIKSGFADDPVGVGAFIATPDGLAIIGCGEPDTTTVARSGDFDALYRAVASVHREDGSSLIASFKGVEELACGTRPQRTVYVHELVAVWPEETCEKAGVHTTLDNTYWKLVDLNGSPVAVHEDQRETHIILRTQGNQIGGFAGCNKLTGRYQVDGEHLRFIDVGSTETACEYLDEERAFIDVLSRVTNYQSVGESLQLRDDTGPVARLRAVYFH